MTAVDTNVLVYAHRTETARHERAQRWLRHLAEGMIPWALPCSASGSSSGLRRTDGFDPPSTIRRLSKPLMRSWTAPR